MINPEWKIYSCNYGIGYKYRTCVLIERILFTMSYRLSSYKFFDLFWYRMYLCYCFTSIIPCHNNFFETTLLVLDRFLPISSLRIYFLFLFWSLSLSLSENRGYPLANANNTYCTTNSFLMFLTIFIKSIRRFFYDVDVKTCMNDFVK